MRYLPLVFDVRDKACLIVGGGDVALRKASLLARAGAKVDIVAAEVLPELAELAMKSGGEVVTERYSHQALEHYKLVIAATSDAAVNEQVARDCFDRDLLVNVVDKPALCNVIFPAIIDRDPILVSVSSSGAAPVLARKVRTDIETSVPANYGSLASFIGERRAEVAKKLSGNRLRLFWEDFVQSQAAECVLDGKDAEAGEIFARLLDEAVEQAGPAGQVGLGEVYLVGAGPGDPDLLTFKALRLMQRADVVLYDRLVAPAIVDLCRRDAERIYVGKARADHAVPQQEINQLLISHAQQGKKVLRLKGGDPFIFGRGGEEISGLAELDIPFQIVPGISAANGCACYAGIPLTHRDHAQSVRFITGHLKDGSVDLPWSELIQPQQTVVIYMGLQSLPVICEQLIAQGADENTPIALIERGTTPQQKSHIGTLGSIVDIVARQDVHAPTILIIGSVVSLHNQFKWRS